MFDKTCEFGTIYPISREYLESLPCPINADNLDDEELEDIVQDAEVEVEQRKLKGERAIEVFQEILEKELIRLGAVYYE